MHDPRTDEAIDALLAGRARRRGRPIRALIPAEAGPPLTGLESRISWTDALRREQARQQRYGHAASIVAFGIQPLTEVARLDGWLDRVAPPVAHAIRRGARETDLVTRTGPGLFQVLLPETTEIEAQALADRIVADCQVWLDAMAAPLAIRGAGAGIAANDDPDAALDRALQALHTP